MALLSLCFVAPHRKIPGFLRMQVSTKTCDTCSSAGSTQLEEGVPSPPSSSRKQRGRSPTAKDLRRASPTASDSRADDDTLAKIDQINGGGGGSVIFSFIPRRAADR
jgi:hypothetical protein